MFQETHVLKMSFGIDFAKILSEPYLSGVMLTLGIDNKEKVIEWYGNHLNETILKSIENREDIAIMHSELSIIEKEDNKQVDFLDESESEDQDEYSIFKKLDFEEVENVTVSTYSHKGDEKQKMTDMLLDSLRETSYMNNLELSELHIKNGVEINYDLLSIDEDVEIITKESFEEDPDYNVSIPFKLILRDKETKKETTILGGI